MDEFVKDIHGNVLGGVVKDPSGHIFVEKNSEYQKYKKEKERLQRLDKLENDVTEIKDLLRQLLNK